MITLIKNIQGDILTNIVGNVNNSSEILGEIQREDYIDIYAFTAFLQNLSQTPKTSRLNKPIMFGYALPSGITQKNIDINY